MFYTLNLKYISPLNQNIKIDLKRKVLKYIPVQSFHLSNDHAWKNLVCRLKSKNFLSTFQQHHFCHSFENEQKMRLGTFCRSWCSDPKISSSKKSKDCPSSLHIEPEYILKKYTWSRYNEHLVIANKGAWLISVILMVYISSFKEQKPVKMNKNNIFKSVFLAEK